MITCFIRTVLLYTLLVVGLRLMGKKQAGELETSELVLAMVLSDLASVPMQDFGIPLIYGCFPIIIVLALTMMLSVLTMRSVKFRALLCGRPSIIVENGVIQQQAMSQNRFTTDELFEELRLQGVNDISTIRYAILENSGEVSILLHAKEQPPSAADLHVTTEEKGIPITLITDGIVLDKNLRMLGKDRAWLASLLKKHQARRFEEVYLLTVDQRGHEYFARKEGRRA